MASPDTTPRIVLGPVAKGRGTQSVLIVAGAASGELPDGTSRIVLLQDALEIGRGTRADFPDDWTDDPLMSRRHARITRLPNGRYALRDLDSTNGTWLNGVRLLPGVRRKLDDGAVIMTGNLVYVFRRA